MRSTAIMNCRYVLPNIGVSLLNRLFLTVSLELLYIVLWISHVFYCVPKREN